MEKKDSYNGRVTNAGAQAVNAPNTQPKNSRNVVISGNDLRTGRTKSGK